MTDVPQGGLFDEPAPAAAPAAPLWPCKDRCQLHDHERPHAKATECGRTGCQMLRAAAPAKDTK